MIPKGTVLVHLLHLYGQDKVSWGEDCQEFNPDRFKEDNERHKHSFLPFGVGPRACIGRDLAKLEFKVLLSFVLKNFELRPFEGEVVTPMRYVSVKPKSGYKCYLTPRQC